MSAPSERGAARCACTNISLMQLFHELKQKFPAAPDHAVSAAISLYCHDKRACEQHLEHQASASLAHAYHASSSAAARKLKNLNAAIVPLECRNRIIERQFPALSDVRELICDKAQNAKLTCITIDNNSNIELIEASNDVQVDKTFEETSGLEKFNDADSVDDYPITINLDNCVDKNGETFSDIETEDVEKSDVIDEPVLKTNDSSEISNYRILKSHKIKNDLNVRLEKPKEKNVIKQTLKEVVYTETSKETDSEKPRRPCTLEFIKPEPELNTKQNLHKSATQSLGAILPVVQHESHKENPRRHWPEQYPLNLSVNVNCHMDLANRPHNIHYNNPWEDDYQSPRTFTSVNLTVSTPTSGSMQSPGRDLSVGEARSGFEGHLTVTVSPSSTHPCRAAPPPPNFTPQTTVPQNYVVTPKHHSTAVPASSLVARQLARKRRLEEELRCERERLSQVANEASVLSAPLPAPTNIRRLRDEVELLRQQCQAMTRQLDINNATREMGHEDLLSGNYSIPRVGASISPTPLRPAPPPPEEAPSWQCQICTFSNHGLLNKCEQCEMPRILIGTHTRPLTHETKLDNSVLLGNATPNPTNPACV